MLISKLKGMLQVKSYKNSLSKSKQSDSEYNFEYCHNGDPDGEANY